MDVIRRFADMTLLGSYSCYNVLVCSGSDIHLRQAIESGSEAGRLSLFNPLTQELM